MQIVATFESYEEMDAFARKILGDKKAPTKKELNESAKKTAEIINRAEAKEAAEKKEAPAEDDELPFKEEEDKKVSESDAKALLSRKIKEGHKAEVKELFNKYGVEKFSELIEKYPDKLEEFYKEAEAI